MLKPSTILLSSLTIFFSFMTVAYAELIEIKSDSLNIQKKGISVYQGNAEFTQGSKYLAADQISILRENKKVKYVKAIGSATKLAFLKTLDENNKLIQAWSQSMHYDLQTKIVTLNKSAKLQQDNDLIIADKIIINLETESVVAQSNNNTRVKAEFETE